MKRIAIAGAIILSSFLCSAQCGSCNQGSAGATWEGDVDSDWNNANNWSGNTLPTGGAVTIDGDLYTNAPIISTTSSFSPTDVFIQDGATLTLQADLALTDDFIIRNNSSLVIQGGSNATGDDINLCAGGSINMSGGTLDNTSGSGILRVCTSTPAGATGTTELVLTGGTITSTTSDTETGTISDFVTTSGSGTYSDGGGVLPVELIHFSGSTAASHVTLNWSTASELNNEYFDIQKSWDGINFSTIGRMAGHGTTNDLKEYTFQDLNPWKTNYYRLQQVDYNGDSEIHPTIRVSHSLGKQAYKISYRHDRTIPLKIQSEFELNQVQLFNGTGQILYENSQLSQVEILTNNLDPGLYFIQMQWGEKVVKEKILLTD